MKKPTFQHLIALTLAIVGGPMIARAAPGDLYVTSGFNPGSILRFNPAGGRSTFASGLNGPYGLAFDAAASPSTLFESDNSGGVIYKFQLDGTMSTFAMLSNVLGLAVDGSGNLYAADNSGHNIYRYTPNGTRTTFASDVGNPEGLAFDSQNHT
jgi:sugar lactone lactonase YvrE